MERRGGSQTATTATYGTLSTSDHSTQLRKAVIAATIATAIEWYDFFIYGTVAGLIFGKLYFPAKAGARRLLQQYPPKGDVALHLTSWLHGLTLRHQIVWLHANCTRTGA